MLGPNFKKGDDNEEEKKDNESTSARINHNHFLADYFWSLLVTDNDDNDKNNNDSNTSLTLLSHSKLLHQ